VSGALGPTGAFANISRRTVDAAGRPHSGAVRRFAPTAFAIGFRAAASSRIGVAEMVADLRFAGDGPAIAPDGRGQDFRPS